MSPKTRQVGGICPTAVATSTALGDARGQCRCHEVNWLEWFAAEGPLWILEFGSSILEHFRLALWWDLKLAETRPIKSKEELGF